MKFDRQTKGCSILKYDSATESEDFCNASSTTTSAEGQEVLSGIVEPNGLISADGPAIYLQFDIDGNFVQQWSKPEGSSGNTGWT